LRRIFFFQQGTPEGAYSCYVTEGVTPRKGKKTSKMRQLKHDMTLDSVANMAISIMEESIFNSQYSMDKGLKCVMAEYEKFRIRHKYIEKYVMA
jgi:predicted proteasome-type protease